MKTAPTESKEFDAVLCQFPSCEQKATSFAFTQNQEGAAVLVAFCPEHSSK